MEHIERLEIIEKLSEKFTDLASFDDLYQFYFEDQFDHFDSLPDSELLRIFEDHFGNLEKS